MSLVLQGASGAANRVHHTHAILGTVGIAFSAHNRLRNRELEREQQQLQQYGSQETLNQAGTIAVYRMISPAADILTRLGVDHVIIGFLSILLQILLDLINFFWPVYECDPVGPHLVLSNCGIIIGIFYIFIGVVSVKIGGFSRNAAGVEVRRRFHRFHALNFINFLASFAFLMASSLLLYILWLRLHGCQSVDWTFLRIFSASSGRPTSENSTAPMVPVVPSTDAPASWSNVTAVTVDEYTHIKSPGQEHVNGHELHAAIVCALIVNCFHSLIGTLELLMTFVGFCLRAS